MLRSDERKSFFIKIARKARVRSLLQLREFEEKLHYNFILNHKITLNFFPTFNLQSLVVNIFNERVREKQHKITRKCTKKVFSSWKKTQRRFKRIFQSNEFLTAYIINTEPPRESGSFQPVPFLEYIKILSSQIFLPMYTFHFLFLSQQCN